MKTLIQQPGFPIASLDWTDDALGSHVFSLSGIAANNFEIDADTLYLKANTVLGL